MKFILGKKIEMTQIFESDGKITPVTLVKAGPCFVTQIKRQEKDKYVSFQIGFQKIEKKTKIKKSMGKKPYHYLKEFRNKKEENDKEFKTGQEINVSIFEEGEIVAVSGVSKGKGFAGAVKRWGFVDKSKSHGATDMRQLGSTGCRYPQRVIKGKKMPGRMGSDRTTVKNLKIVKIDIENNILAIKGSIPGKRGTLLEIRNNNKTLETSKNNKGQEQGLKSET